MPSLCATPALRLGVLLVLLGVCGCAGTIIPPIDPVNPVTVAVADYGRHSSILLPIAEDRMVEFAYGDWQWFALGDTRLHIGLGALIRSPQATLGRREITVPPEDPDFASQIGVRRFFTFDAAADRVASLVQQLEERFARGGEPQLSHYSNLWMVPDDGTYHLFRNSNHFTAQSVEMLGAQVRGPAITSGFRLR